MKDIFDTLKENIGSNIKLNESLSRHTNFKIGGPAKYYFEALTSTDLERAVQTARELQIPTIVLGGGANVLVSDNGFAGLVIIAKNQIWSINGNLVSAEAGVNLGFLVSQTVSAGLAGLEPLVAIPGSVGGAVYGNAGLPQIAKGCIGDWIYEVTVLGDDKIVKLNNKQCKFSYRNSLFKQTKDIILSVILELKPADKLVSEKLIKKYIAQRKGQPYHLPSTGCIFTNVEVKTKKQEAEIKNKITSEPKLDDFLLRGQIPAGWLIELAGLKGKIIGGVQVSTDHANYIVNINNAKAEHVVMLISFIKQQVRDKFGIQLKEEVQYIGF
ncbi:MAG: UDP-N-acetylmuramate dehydrogenase [Patescibacteria group bacterium]